MRGSRTHGRGKKHGRGKGHRGGSGNAGLLKHKFKWMVKYDPDHFGRHGFVRHAATAREKVSINVAELQERLEAFVAQGVAQKRGKGYDVNLTKAGVDKLLGAGRATLPLRVIVAQASERAVAKIQEAGGEVVARNGEA
jgi:large subunit ribosomal protein L15